MHCHQLQGIHAQYLLKLRRRIQNVAADLAIKLPEARRALEDFIRELEIQMSSQETKSQVHNQMLLLILFCLIEGWRFDWDCINVFYDKRQNFQFY